GEVYGMTSGERSRRIESAINRALVYHREVQTRKKTHPADNGGWRYGFPDSPGAASDMSVTGWALMFLRSARNAEFNIPKQDFDDGLDFVERCFEPDAKLHEKGVFRYRPALSDTSNPPQITLANTSSAMLSLILGGRQDKESVAVGVRWFLVRDYPRPWQTGYFYLSTYYSSQAMAQVGGDAWNHVFPQIARNLLEEQVSDGSWPAAVSSERKFGPVYTTSLAVLALTPPYQLLPIYQR
ncbi:MAG TPA: prenyltransferase/squalene oxidase repeat-containing protein, partial [Planctomycetaceae bacterium]|nr:prenyltransferase/squalene oxidase repeat-containing protein [Planctomycetaceae bacterium]